MKETDLMKERDMLVLIETASGEIFLKELESQLWWRVPTEQAPVDFERLQEDCKSICSGTDYVSYLEYVGMYDTTDVLVSDERYERFIGAYPFGRFHTDTARLEIEPWYAGPDNLRLFGMEEHIAELPKIIARFHNEATRICRKIVAEANELRSQGDKHGWFFRASIADTIQNLRCIGLVYEADDASIWFQESVWQVLAELCNQHRPEKPEDAFWLYLAAYELDGVYLPIPDDIIEGIKDNPWLVEALSEHASKMHEAGWVPDEERDV